MEPAAPPPPEPTSGQQTEFANVRRRDNVLASLLDQCDLALTSRHAAAKSGFASASELERFLRHSGLPPYRLLRDWWYLVALLRRAENGESIVSFALGNRKDPAPYYRFAVRVSGQKWVELKRRGTDWATTMALNAWAPFLHVE